MADDSVMRSDDVDVDDTIDMEHYRTLVQRFIGLVSVSNLGLTKAN